MLGGFYADEKAFECRLLAKSGGSGHVAGPTAQPPGADVHTPMSAFSGFRRLYAMPRTTAHRRAAQLHPKRPDSERMGTVVVLPSPGGAQETLCLKLDAGWEIFFRQAC